MSDQSISMQNKVEKKGTELTKSAQPDLSMQRFPPVERALNIPEKKGPTFVAAKTVRDIVATRVDRVGNDVIQNSLYDALLNLGRLTRVLPERRAFVSNRFMDLVRRMDDIRNSVIIQRVIHGDTSQAAKERERLIKNRKRKKEAGVASREKSPQAMSKKEILDFLTELKSEIVNFGDLEEHLLQDLLKAVHEVEDLTEREF